MNHALNEAREAVLAYALSLPGTREDHPWGERVAKVGKKIFVFCGRSSPDDPNFMIAVKLPQSGLRALDLPFTEPTGYGMGKHGWVSANFTGGDRPPMDQLRAWVLESYCAIAPKAMVKQMNGPAGAPGAKASKPAAKESKPKAAPKKKKVGSVRARASKTRSKKKTAR